jgi:HemY protein
MAPKHPYVLQLLQSLYQDMDQWQEVQAVLPDLRKRHVLESDQVQALTREAAVGQLEAALFRQDWRKVAAVWEKAPARMRQSEAMLKPYVNALIKQGENEQAIALIEQFMRKNWSDELVYMYGQISTGDLLKRLSAAEKWLKSRQDNPWLLLALGKLAKANDLWTKAEEYLLASIQHGARGETYQALAEVQTALGEREAAARTYQAGLELMLRPVNDVHG